ncbi:hypothetical protein RFI_23488 [Reticulomyxa filosa]|uniref:Uncharacterized protein n=1 Tax=Reticulomyxa filosa TaxID=46433 RepID=X6MJT2_RETFI|nr:hypothetical protein RFI_23488 [Reticulomyxa filosa]|eukprot:ETO13881.1 hypothetical protein RFI_23488 [Reticulomyxa filosa]
MNWYSEVYPYHDLFHYQDLCTDIDHLRIFLTKVLDLRIDTKSNKTSITTNNVSLDTRYALSEHCVSRLTNRNGPIPVWTIHEPFRFDVGKWLDCPLSFPLNLLSGFSTIAFSTGSKRALDGLSFDEYNYIVNLLHGVIGHNNLCFMNLFMAFDSHRMYADASALEKESSKVDKVTQNNKQDKDKDKGKGNGKGNEEKEKDDEMSMHQFALIHDYIDFHGGFPRYPFPLFPSNVIEESEKTDKELKESTKFPELHFDYKRGTSDHTKSDCSYATVISCIADIHGSKTKTYGYGWWPGPQLPSKAELTVCQKAHCELVGISNPELAVLARQLGHDGFNVAFVANYRDLQHVSSLEMMQECTHNIYDVSIFIKQISNDLIAKLPTSSKTQHSLTKSYVHEQQLQLLKGVDFPVNIPTYQVLFDVEIEWITINNARDWLSKQWKFDTEHEKIENVLFSHFSHPFLYQQENKGTEVLSINLAQIPGFMDHYCGGVAYTHFHYQNVNPLDWTLKIYKNCQDKSKYYAVVAPQWFVERDRDNMKEHLHGNDPFESSKKNIKKRSAYDQALRNFYRYSPSLWNLNFFVRVLWKCGIKNIVFLTELLGTDNEKFNLPPRNGVVLVSNYVDESRWSCLTGPNDERLGPRFIPITEPMDGNDILYKTAKRKNFGELTLRQVEVVHAPPYALISPLSKQFYASFGIPVIFSFFFGNH